jgi:phage terminase Nu1 subunit (DNA packaging protein)
VKKILTITEKEFREKFKFSGPTVDKLIAEGMPVKVNLPYRRRFDLDAVEEWFKNKKEEQR